MSSKIHCPPWYDAETGETYGPQTVATYAKHVAAHRDWAYRKPGPERPEAQQVHAYVMACHADVPPSQMDAYRAVFVHRLSTREAAQDLGLSRDTVRSYVRRLVAKARDWKLDTNPDSCE